MDDKQGLNKRFQAKIEYTLPQKLCVYIRRPTF